MTNTEEQQRSLDCTLEATAAAATTTVTNPSTTTDKKQQPSPTGPTNQQLRQASSNKFDDRPHPAPRQQPPTRQARPLRPGKLRRQAVLVAASAGVQPLSLNLAADERQPNETATTSIELAGVLPGNLLPPKRPAYLPARYEGTYRASAALVGGPRSITAASKPNRYMWAQWPPPPPSSATQHSMSLSGQTGDKADQFAVGASHLHPHHHHQQQQQQHHDHHHGGFHHHFAAPFSSAASRVMVVNPMQIVNLSEHTKSRLIKFIEAIKRFSEKWFSHVLLLLFLAVYACLGAYIFISFEAPTEHWEKQLIIDNREKMVNESFNEAMRLANNREQFNELFIGKLEDYERLLSRACASGMSSSSLENQWTFWGALFYSMTVFTTIGYGHLTPITFAGRVATMIYAIFGIPILLMVLADLGKLLTRIIKYAFKKFRYLFNKLLRKKSSLKTRKLISDNTNQYIGVARDALERGVAYIQPQYNRIPDALRYNSLSRRFRRQKPQRQQVLESDNIATSGDRIIAEEQQQQQDEENAEKIEQMINEQKGDAILIKKKASSTSADTTRLTDVIVTPNKQTKPVSPQLSNEKRHLSQSADTNHGHQHHGGQQQHHHRSMTHHNYHGHNNRGQSLGAQWKRKLSTTNSAGFLSKRAAAKGSVSRSSSSSQMVIGSTGGLEKKAKQSMGDQLSADLPSTVAEQPVPVDDTRINSRALPPAAVESGAMEDDVKRKPIIGIVPMTTGIATGGETEFISGDEELQEVDLTGNEDDDNSEEDEFDIPVSFALFLLVTYMMFGAAVFSIWEGWNFFDSLYFVFISMSTIGFGDLVPQHPKRMIGTFIYLLFGLALTSMCINVVQEKIHATFLRAKMQIGEKMGLDLDQIMADDYYNDGSIVTEGDEDDSNSVAVSQTNSSLAHICPTDQDLLEHSAIDCHQLGKLASLETSGTSEGVKMSKSKDSLKSVNKRRTITGLPGHNSHNNSLRRKPSKKSPLQRQTTPSGGAGSMSSPSTEQAPPVGSPGQQILNNVLLANKQLLANANKQAQRAQIEVVLEKTEQLVGINHPIEVNLKNCCEPLMNGGGSKKLPNQQVNGQQPKQEQHKLMAVNCGPVMSHCVVGKSLSSDSRFNQVNKKGAPRMGLTARSADSSRRSSVSFELNQLDDLILGLSQSPSERFGPLLGIPSSTRSSCSSSPSTSLARRATSMINKPATRSNLDRSLLLNQRKKKTSIVTHTSPAAALLKISRPPTNLTDTTQATHEELGRIKFSAV